MHLKEIVQKGLIKEKKEKEKENQSMKVQWILTEKSNNILPISSMHYVSSFKRYSEIVFEDKKNQRLKDVSTTRSKRDVFKLYK